MNSFRGGMQVHSVPESERAVDANGRKLPWGYEYADSGRNERTQETGPFGKSMRRRGLSRTRTATPAEKKDQRDRDENLRAMDAAMSNLKERSKQASMRGQPGMTASLSQSSPEGQAAPEAIPAAQTSAEGEPTEVSIYGVPASLQYAALSFYERASGGLFYEDYDRDAPTQRFNSFTRSVPAGRSISNEALRKKNAYAGGENWIKITFDSREAADRACHASPHVVKGYLAHAEPYRGAFQRLDQPVPATEANIQSAQASPSQSSSRTLAVGNAQNGDGSPTPSGTASSATATQPRSLLSSQRLPQQQQQQQQDLQMQSAQGRGVTQIQSVGTSTGVSASPAKQQPLRVRGAKRAVLIPAEQALLPAPSKLQRTLAAIPVVGWILSGGSELIGGSVPRKEDGGFDGERASVWWRFWYAVDAVTGWDTCGLRGGYED